jgi:hypothetical protein
MKTKALLLLICVLAVGLVVNGAQADLPKQGKYRGMFGARAAGTVHELDKGHVFFVGGFSGVFFNDNANGFMDQSAVECPGVNDIVNGVAIANGGYCIVTDRDGDKAFLVWKGKETSQGVGGGDFQWTAGTGKYDGIKGNNTFHYTSIGNTSAFSVVWEGEWQLP